MKLTLAAVLLTLAAALTGCSTPSLNALASDDTAIADDGLTGVWQPIDKDSQKPEEDETYTITSTGDRQYEVTIQKKDDKDKPMQFALRLVKLGDTTFIDMTVSSSGRKEMERFGTTLAPMHNFFKYKRDDDTLEVWALDNKYLENALKNGDLKLGYALHEEKDVVITASTADLQAFFKANAASPDLFEAPGTLKRKPQQPKSK
jgi:hypothetical protein